LACTSYSPKTAAAMSNGQLFLILYAMV